MRRLAIAALLAPPLAALADPPRELTEAECLEFAKLIQKSVNAGDSGLLESSLDLDAILDKAMTGFPVPPKAAQAFRAW